MSTGRVNNIEKYYDEMASEYEDIVRNWGYNMPETILATLIDHCQISKITNRHFSLLDLGCGDGLGGFVIQVNFNVGSNGWTLEARKSYTFDEFKFSRPWN